MIVDVELEGAQSEVSRPPLTAASTRSEMIFGLRKPFAVAFLQLLGAKLSFVDMRGHGFGRNMTSL